MEKEPKEFQDTNLVSGLNNQEVQERIATYGYNEVPEKKVSFSQGWENVSGVLCLGCLKPQL